MASLDIEKAVLKEHGLRITPAMCDYILAKLKTSRDRELAIIAGDARTGVPVRTTIPIETLASFATQQS